MDPYTSPAQATKNRRRPRVSGWFLAGCLVILAGVGRGQQADRAPGGISESPSGPVSGVVSGEVTDADGELLQAARITLSQGAAARVVLTDDTGHFSFVGVSPGAFQLTVEAPGFALRKTMGELHAGESDELPAIRLEAAASIEVQVRPVSEVAQEQLKEEEKQRVLGFMPNFYVSYEPNPAPLNTKQKYQLAWKNLIDPVNIGLIAGFAGISQAANTYPGFGQGAAGYGKRLGAGYGGFASAALLSGAFLPQVFKQDPRYLYKGTGSRKARTWYALKSVLVCRSDNGRWGACYSNVLGTFGGGAVSNLFYAPSDRNGAALTFENGGLGLAGDAFENLMEEFVVRHFTSKLSKRKHQP